MNSYLLIKAKELLDGATPTSTPTSLIPGNENIKRLIEAIGENQLSVKEMLVAVGLKDRPNFLKYSLSPAINEGYVRMLYPDSPRHPRQKYLLIFVLIFNLFLQLNSRYLNRKRRSISFSVQNIAIL